MKQQMLARPSPATAAAGLFVAWLVHDAEELAFFRATMPAVAERLRGGPVPEALAERLTTTSQTEMALAIGLVGVVIAAATYDGIRTEENGLFFQIGLLGFGLHGLVHIAQTVLSGGYTPGVVTSVLVVLPYSIAAVFRMRRRGLLNLRRLAVAGMAGITLFLPTVLLARLFASALTGGDS